MILSPPEKGKCRISSSQLQDINSLLDNELSILHENSKEGTNLTLSINQNPITTANNHKKSFSNQIVTSTKKDLQFIKKRITSLELKLNTLAPTPDTLNSSEFTIPRAMSFDRWLSRDKKPFKPFKRLAKRPKNSKKASKENSTYDDYLQVASDFLSKTPPTYAPSK
jgi:hypothetical protein